MKKLICSFVYMALGMMALTSCVDNDDDLGDIQVPCRSFRSIILISCTSLLRKISSGAK